MEFEKHFCRQKISGFCTSFLLANFLLVLLSAFSNAQQNQPSNNTQYNSTNSITPDNIGGGGAILAKINFQIAQILATT